MSAPDNQTSFTHERILPDDYAMFVLFAKIKFSSLFGTFQHQLQVTIHIRRHTIIHYEYVAAPKYYVATVNAVASSIVTGVRISK